MSGFTFRKAARENVHLLAGFMGGTGSGKTYTALRVATGLSAGKRFCVIDTEAGRALHYADRFAFDHGDLKPPFSPDAYLEAILAAEAAGYPVAVVDSMSHEHAGEGGLLDQHEKELARMAGDDYGKRERVKFAAWIAPKMAHKRMLSRLLQLRMHLILCFRAEPKMKPQKNAQGKMEFVDAGWLPICAKGLEFELTASFLLHHEHPGVYRLDGSAGYGQALKLPEDLRSCFPEGKFLDERCGELAGAWAAGGKSPQASEPPPDAAIRLISDSQVADVEALLQEVGADRAGFLRWLKAAVSVERIDDIPADKLGQVIERLERKRAAGARS